MDIQTLRLAMYRENNESNLLNSHQSVHLVS